MFPGRSDFNPLFLTRFSKIGCHYLARLGETAQQTAKFLVKIGEYSRKKMASLRSPVADKGINFWK